MGAFAGGTFCTGLVLSSLHLNPIQIDAGGSSELIASLVGAIVGGAVSIIGTYVFNSQERRRNELSQAHRLLLTISLIASDIHNIVRYVEKQVQDGWPIDLWTKIVPNAGSFQQRVLESSDLSLLIVAKEFSLLSDLHELEMLHSSIGEGWNAYCISRRDLINYMPVDSMTGARSTAELNNKDHPQAMLRIVEIDTLLKNTLKLAYENDESILPRVSKAMKTIFGESNFPTAVIVK